MPALEITPKQKQEVESQDEQTRPGRYYRPDVDIYETENAILLRADMPGASESSVSVELNQDVLSIAGHVATDEYQGLKPVYTEYNVGHFVRRFTLPDAGRLDRERISARIAHGVLEVTIPKSERAKPRRIEVKGTA